MMNVSTAIQTYQTESESRPADSFVDKVADRFVRVANDNGLILYDDQPWRILARFFARYFGWRKLNTAPPPKGLILYGPTGTGKTVLGTFLASQIKAKIDTTRSIMEDIHDTEGNYLSSYKAATSSNAVLLDDLGAEKNVKIYGNEYDITDILYARHDLFCNARNKQYTIITTNLTPDDVRRRYGDRIESRLYQMCVWIPFRGSDKRKL